MGIHINGEPGTDSAAIADTLKEHLTGPLDAERKMFLTDSEQTVQAIIDIATQAGVVNDVQSAMSAAWAIGAVLYLVKMGVVTFEQIQIPDVFEDAFEGDSIDSQDHD